MTQIHFHKQSISINLSLTSKWCVQLNGSIEEIYLEFEPSAGPGTKPSHKFFPLPRDPYRIGTGFKVNKDKIGTGFMVNKDQIGTDFKVNKDRIGTGFQVNKDRVGTGFKVNKDRI